MTQSQTSIPCSVNRGGTSRGLFFCAADLPEDEAVPELLVRQAGVIRTARTLMRGSVFVPKEIWTDEDAHDRPT